VDDKQGIVKRIGGTIRLKSFDQPNNVEVLDPLYFSVKSLHIFRLSRPFFEYRKLNPFVFVCGPNREMPNNVIKAGSKVMNDLASQNIKPWGNRETLMVLRCLQRQLAIVMWQDWEVAFLKKTPDLQIEIVDVLLARSSFATTPSIFCIPHHIARLERLINPFAPNRSIILGTTTPEEWDRVKAALRRPHELEKELWIEKVLMRDLVISRGWMTEAELDSVLERSKKNPENIQEMEQHFAPAEQQLAELGLADWLAQFDKQYPHSDQA